MRTEIWPLLPDRTPITKQAPETKNPTPENSIVLGPGSCPEPVRYSERDLAATRISKGPDETGQPAGVDDPLNFLAEADPHLVVSWVPHLFPLPGAAEPHVLLEAVARRRHSESPPVGQVHSPRSA